jgi:fatty-acyl-CoA synthase/long-chain acyl-CoA synthetase
MRAEELLDVLRPLWAKVLPGPEREPVYPFGERPLTEYLRQWAKREPQRAAIVYYGAVTTYAELDEQSDRFAALLAARGIQPGARVAVFLPNCPAFMVAFWGILKAGCVHVPCNPMFRERELTHELVDAEASAIVTLQTLRPLVKTVRAAVPSLACVITTTLQEQFPAEPDIPVPPNFYDAGNGCEGDLDLKRALAATARVVTRERSGELDTLAALNYTGGTTGLPKGCEHTQRDMLYTAASSVTFGIGARTGYISLVFLPVFWIAGENTAVITPVLSGSTVVLLGRWDAATVLQAIQRYRVDTMTGMVDSWLELMDHPDRIRYDLSSLQLPTAISFVTRLAKGHRERWKAIAGPNSVLREAGYGMTETHTGDTTTRGMQAHDADLETGAGTMVGVPMPGTDILIADFETHEFKPIGEPGEVLVRTPSATRGYWRKPEATRELFVHGRWLRTGDNGQLDAGGRLRYLGRRKEMLKVNGMSVFPSELEVIMASHPQITAVAVIGVPDEKRGQRPLAFVQVRADDEISAAALHAWCVDNMARYKIPTVRLVRALPLAPTGKIDKIALARLAETER